MNPDIAEPDADVVTSTSARAACAMGTGVLLAIGGLVGLVSAAALLIEKIRSLEDPEYIPSCNISPIVSCGSVMNSPQAEAFGFPNPILGVAGFAAIAALGVVATATVLPRWVWFGIQGGVTFGVVFVHWLVFQSLYRLDALCPYCLVVWVVTIALFVYVTRHNLLAAAEARGRADVFTRTLRDWHGVVLTGWYLVIAALIVEHFWWYWSDLL